MEIDVETKARYYNVYEYRPTTIKLDDRFLNASGPEREELYQSAQFSYFKKGTEDEFFEAVPIIVYDYAEKSYVFKNNISDRFYDELYRSGSIEEERTALEKLFRPDEYLKKHESDIQGTSKKALNDFIREQNLNWHFITLDK
jgi:hypothetical protein